MEGGQTEHGTAAGKGHGSKARGQGARDSLQTTVRNGARFGTVMQEKRSSRSVTALKTRLVSKSRGTGDLVVERELQSSDREPCGFCCGMLSRAAPRWPGRGVHGSVYRRVPLPGPPADRPSNSSGPRPWALERRPEVGRNRYPASHQPEASGEAA